MSNQLDFKPHNDNQQSMQPTLDSTIKLDQWGPVVINQDGTMSRISNWQEMTEMEQKNVMRIIPKRNRERLAILQQSLGKETEL